MVWKFAAKHKLKHQSVRTFVLWLLLFCCCCLSQTSHLFSSFFFFTNRNWRKIKNTKKYKKQIQKNFFDYFLWALSCCFRWMAELSFHTTTTTTTKHSINFTIFFIYVFSFCSFFIFENQRVNYGRIQNFFFFCCLLYLTLAKGFFFWF